MTKSQSDDEFQDRVLLGFPKTSTESEHGQGAANLGKTSEVTHIHTQRKDLGHEDETDTLSFLDGLSSAVSPRSPMRTRGMKREEENVFHARGQSQGKPMERSSPPEKQKKQCQHTITAPLKYQADAFAVQPPSQPTPGPSKEQEVWWGLKKCLQRGVTGNPPYPVSLTHIVDVLHATFYLQRGVTGITTPLKRWTRQLYQNKHASRKEEGEGGVGGGG